MTVTRLFVALISVLLFSSGALAASIERQDVVSAKATVKKYQELRKLCAVSRGLSRKDCFSELNDANGEYKDAKKTLADLKGQGEENLHLVTYAD